MTTNPREAVGTRFDPALMQRARERSWDALQGIREQMQPGISEDEAQAAAAGVFRRLGPRECVGLGPGAAAEGCRHA